MKKHYTASAIVLFEHRILLLWHNKLQTWLYPGGHIEEGESPDEAVVREVMEETGLEIEFINHGNFSYHGDWVNTLNLPVAVFEEFIEDAKENHIHIDFVYLCKVKSGKIRINEKESKNFCWLSRSEMDQFDLYDNIKELFLRVFDLDFK